MCKDNFQSKAHVKKDGKKKKEATPNGKISVQRLKEKQNSNKWKLKNVIPMC